MNHNRPWTMDLHEPSGVAVQLLLSQEDLEGIKEVGLVDGLRSLNHFFGLAIPNYVSIRRSDPKFPDQMAEARLRCELDILTQQHPEHPSAPIDNF